MKRNILFFLHLNKYFWQGVQVPPSIDLFAEGTIYTTEIHCKSSNAIYRMCINIIVNCLFVFQPKSIIVFKLVIRRKTLFYTVNLIIPCFLHALVCLCVFVLPAHGSEKITLVISVLVSLVVFLLLLQKVSCCDSYRKHKASYYVPYDDIVPVKFVFVLPINS